MHYNKTNKCDDYIIKYESCDGFSQSRARCRSSQLVSQSKVGERTSSMKQFITPDLTPVMDSASMLSTTSSTNSAIKMSNVQNRLSINTSGKAAAWSEKFQDLDSWCPQALDELNTPDANNQDEFNFSFDDQGRNSNWDNTSPLELQMWESSDNWLLSSSFLVEENNNNHNNPFETVHSNNNIDKFQQFSTDNNTDVKHFNKVNSTVSSTPPPIVIKEEDVSSPSGCLFSMTHFEDQSIDPFETLDKLNSSWTLPRSNNVETYSTNLPTVSSNTKETGNISKMSISDSKMQEKKKLKLHIPKTESNNNMQNLIDTPDVLRSLTDDVTGFNLLTFVNGETVDSQSLMTSSDLQYSQKQESSSPVNTLESDHDYAAVNPGKVTSETNNVVIKEEPDLPKTYKRKRRSTSTSEDYFDSDEISSDCSDEWPSRKNYKKSKIQKRKNTKTNNSNRLTTAILGPGRRAGRKSTSTLETVDSDDGSSVASSSVGKYRELRDRNNEASRRSRQNRKQREFEMHEMASNLEKENYALKIKADTLQKKICALRALLIKVAEGKAKTTT